VPGLSLAELHGRLVQLEHQVRTLEARVAELERKPRLVTIEQGKVLEVPEGDLS
jgi:hypothetical protein